MKEWEVNIDKAGFWKVRKNPYGNGLLLLVSRGIPCANHCQVISGYCVNDCDKEDVEEAIRTGDYNKTIEKFVKFIKDMEETYDFEREEEYVVFCCRLITDIVETSENLWIERFEGGDREKSF